MSLLTREEITATAAADDRAHRLFARRSRQPMAVTRCVLFIPRDPIHADKYVRACLDRAEEHRYTVTGLTHDPDAVCSLAIGHLIDAVLAAAWWRAGRFDEIEPVLIAHEVRLVVIREHVPHRVTVDPVVFRLHSLGVDVDTIAAAVRSTPEQVRKLLGQSGQPHEARPQRRPAAQHR